MADMKEAAKVNTDVEDFEKAFPTAQMVAYWRAYDAQQEKPQIGTNIGVGPDLAAKHLCGKVGKQMAIEYADASMSSHAVSANSMAVRTQYYDKQWMSAVDDGVKQFVIVACGVDARAWRLPGLEDCTVFEIDVPQCHAFKRSMS